MAMTISIDVSGFKEYKKALEKTRDSLDIYIDAAIKEISGRVLREARKNTPVGVYGQEINFTTKDGTEVSFTPNKGKTGGTLRKGWYVEEYAYKKGAYYEIKVVNNVHYASYVESGHRTRNHTSWVPGVFMLKIAENKVEKVAEKIIEKHLERAFKGL